jgi:HPt (histidine-containing phosphotransfer) domain-containing protein
MLSKPRPRSDTNTQVAGSPPHIDVERFRADLSEAGVEDMLDALLGTFAQDCPTRLAALEQAVHAGRANEIVSAAHAFKSGAGTVRATFLADCLGRTETAARTGDLESVSGLLEQIRSEYQAVLAQLTARPPQ